MDGARFSKFCKDCQVINSKLTTTDVDILFNKCKAKGARRLDWDSFQTAFSSLATMRFPNQNPRDAFQSLLQHVADKGPVARATVAQTGGVYGKLTDTTLYTGSHKNRFDSNGVGMGAAGRVDGSNTRELSQLVNREFSTYNGNTNSAAAPPSNVSGPTNSTSIGAAKKRGQTSVVTASVENLEIKNNPGKKADTHSSTGSLHKNAATKSTGSMNTSNSSINKSSNQINKSSNQINKPATTSGGAGTSVFDRLTNTSGYTGSHKQRFNADGSGRGLAGRDTIAKGGGTTSTDGLAKILRA